MSSIFSRREFGVKRVEWFELFGRIAVTTVGYPIEYVKVLIQIGHEPIPPKETRTLLGKPALALPGVWTYMKHIKNVDGFFGLYRGLAPRLCTNLVSGFTHTMVLDRLPSMTPESDSGEEENDELTDEQKILRFVHELLRITVARCAAVIASQPLHVITIRTIAQFVGREENYRGIHGSLKEIFHQDGVAGYFSGLVPRMVGEIFTLWVSSALTFFITTYVLDDKTLKSYARTTSFYVAGALFYPFTVVSNCVAVNNCGIAAGLPPHMPIYESWTDCWSHLQAISQLKRGSSVLWRYYHGPLLRPYDRRPMSRTF